MTEKVLLGLMVEIRDKRLGKNRESLGENIKIKVLIPG
ncbi:MAG: hypothetical protein JWR09_5404 [Mucilaginibacter sp.]|nr:hypothetical protein [Mucilaginibacter sp.]